MTFPDAERAVRSVAAIGPIAVLVAACGMTATAPVAISYWKIDDRSLVAVAGGAAASLNCA